MAAIMSQQLDWIDTEDVEHITRIIDMARLPVNAPNELSVERFVDLMSVDKKVMDGVLRLVLLRDIGHAVITNEYTQEQLEAAIRSSYPA
jgi:3-dehydroquinate synthase